MFQQETGLENYLSKKESEKFALEKLRNIKSSCFSDRHKPPMHLYLEPGKYRRVCPNCGHSTSITVPLFT